MGTRHRMRKAGQPVALAVSAMALVLTAPGAFAQSQVFIVQSEHQRNIPPFQSTRVSLDDTNRRRRARGELMVPSPGEQAFARRPLPLDSHGVVLRANGELK